MVKQTRDQRLEIARTRLIRVTSAHSIATMRTLEMKISDAGPFNQRIDPHILTEARNELLHSGELVLYRAAPNRPPWYHAGNVPFTAIAERYNILEAIQAEYSQNALVQRVGQALEIATYRALAASNLTFFGGFSNLNDHDDSTLYSKQEPPNHIGAHRIPDNRLLDFLVHHDGIWAGIECKNIREWLYPERLEVRDLLDKALNLDCVPVLIARRIHPSTFLLFNKCGLVVHQTYNQRLASADADLAERARDKTLLSYFDIRLGNEPDERLTKFLTVNLPAVLPTMKKKFADHYDLLAAYCWEGMSYEEFAARVRRRHHGQNEDGDWD